VTPEELYAIWAPAQSVWSPWVIPVPFAQLLYLGVGSAKELQLPNVDWVFTHAAGDLAIVVDLPGADGIHYGLALADKGFRPVPIIDGAPGPDVGGIVLSELGSHSGKANKHASVVDMRGLLRALCEGAHWLKPECLPPDAPPAFLLDSNRMESVKSDLETAYDNRWMVFPQDFPSGRFLWDHGIRKVVLVQDRFVKQPQDDLAHVLLRWQEKGITIENKSMRFGGAPTPIQVSRPNRYRAAWYRALAATGLRRNDAGGFGGYPPDPSRAG
jgi:hypothetical protein